MKKDKRYSKKQVLNILSIYEPKAIMLLGKPDELVSLIEQLEQYINEPRGKYEKLREATTFTGLVKDDLGQKYTKASSECIVSIMSGLLCIMDNINAAEKGHNENKLIPNRVLIRFLNKEYKEEIDEYSEWCKWEKPGIYPVVPYVIIDGKEEHSIERLTKRYEELLEPSKLGLAADKLKDTVPDKLKFALEEAGNAITELDVYEKVMALIADGFDVLVKQSAKVTLSEEYIVGKVNETFDDNHIFSLEEVCFARGYDLSKLVNKFKTQNIFVALAEGGATGAAGLAGIPLNLATSMFIYYRAVQSIAMYYGYDVKNNSDELEIATDVFMQAMDPKQDSTTEMGEVITKIMAISEAAVVKQTVQKGWAAMAERGGLCLLITQLRALAHASARKALQEAGKKSLEETMFNGLFKMIGKKFTQEAVKKAATPAAAIVTALVDVSIMNKVVEYADIFYNKRFVIEKETRINLLQHPEALVDVDFEIIEESAITETAE